MVNQILQAKLESRMIDGDKEALDWLGEKRDEFFASIKGHEFSQEAVLVFENLFVLEQYHFMWEIDDKSKAANDFIQAQVNKLLAWNDSHPTESRSDWYNATSYEVINAAMPLFKYSKKISLGLEEKKVYDAMIKSKCVLGYLYLNAGLWYAFAPAIGGGSDSKAKEYFSTAVNIGATDYEKFFGLVYLSQSEYDLGDRDSCKKRLDDADKILPGNVYVPFVRLVNEAGCTVFEYADDKGKVMSKVKKHKEKN